MSQYPHVERAKSFTARESVAEDSPWVQLQQVAVAADGSMACAAQYQPFRPAVSSATADPGMPLDMTRTSSSVLSAQDLGFQPQQQQQRPQQQQQQQQQPPSRRLQQHSTLCRSLSLPGVEPTVSNPPNSAAAGPVVVGLSGSDLGNTMRSTAPLVQVQTLPKVSLPVICGTLKGVLHVHKGRIVIDKDTPNERELSATEFERLGGRGATKKWRQSIRLLNPDGTAGKPVGDWYSSKGLDGSRGPVIVYPLHHQGNCNNAAPGAGMGAGTANGALRPVAGGGWLGSGTSSSSRFNGATLQRPLPAGGSPPLLHPAGIAGAIPGHGCGSNSSGAPPGGPGPLPGMALDFRQKEARRLAACVTQMAQYLSGQRPAPPWHLMGGEHLAPRIGGQLVDLRAVFLMVLSQDGFEAVSRANQWSQVATALQVPASPGCPNPGAVLQRVYCDFLLRFERHSSADQWEALLRMAHLFEDEPAPSGGAAPQHTATLPPGPQQQQQVQQQQQGLAADMPSPAGPGWGPRSSAPRRNSGSSGGGSHPQVPSPLFRLHSSGNLARQAGLSAMGGVRKPPRQSHSGRNSLEIGPGAALLSGGAQGEDQQRLQLLQLVAQQLEMQMQQERQQEQLWQHPMATPPAGFSAALSGLTAEGPASTGLQGPVVSPRRPGYTVTTAIGPYQEQLAQRQGSISSPLSGWAGPQDVPQPQQQQQVALPHLQQQQLAPQQPQVPVPHLQQQQQQQQQGPWLSQAAGPYCFLPGAQGATHSDSNGPAGTGGSAVGYPLPPAPAASPANAPAAKSGPQQPQFHHHLLQQQQQLLLLQVAAPSPAGEPDAAGLDASGLDAAGLEVSTSWLEPSAEPQLTDLLPASPEGGPLRIPTLPEQEWDKYWDVVEGHYAADSAAPAGSAEVQGQGPVSSSGPLDPTPASEPMVGSSPLGAGCPAEGLLALLQKPDSPINAEACPASGACGSPAVAPAADAGRAPDRHPRLCKPLSAGLAEPAADTASAPDALSPSSELESPAQRASSNEMRLKDAFRQLTPSAAALEMFLASSSFKSQEDLMDVSSQLSGLSLDLGADEDELRDLRMWSVGSSQGWGAPLDDVLHILSNGSLPESLRINSNPGASEPGAGEH